MNKIEINEDGVVTLGEDLHWDTSTNDQPYGAEIATHVLPWLMASPEYGLGFRVEVADPGVFVFANNEEVQYWDTSDESHDFQGAEVADLLRIFLEEGADAAVASANWPYWKGVTDRRWANRRPWPGAGAARRVTVKG